MNRPQKGFTIVELVVTIVVMGFIIPAVSMALTNLSVVNYQARDAALADTAAQNKVESLRALGYNSVSAGTVDFTSELPTQMGAPKNASYTVTDGTDGGVPPLGVKQIDITISYTEYKVSRTLTYRTYVSELGVGQ